MEYIHKNTSELLNVKFSRKTPVFIYYNHLDFQQNRISAVDEGTEGFSEFFKSRLVIPVRYSDFDMQHLAAHEYVHITQFELLYGGFWRSARLIKGLSGLEPLWIMEGMAESASHRILKRDWSSYDKMILRDAVMYKRLYQLQELQNFNALYRDVYLGYKEGHSAIDYLVEEEGIGIYFLLLKALRNNIDPSKAFEATSKKFGSLKEFDEKWRMHLSSQTSEFISDKNRIEKISKIIISDDFDSKNPINLENSSILYISDRWLADEIYIRSENKEQKFLRSFFGSNVKYLNSGRRFDKSIAYSESENIIVFSARKKQKDRLYLYDIESAKKIAEFDFGVEEIRSPAITENANMIAFTALKDGKRNIYIYNRSKKKLRRLTDDKKIDYAPVFSLDEKYILTATERDLATDLRKIDIISGESQWLTDTEYNEIHPAYLSDDVVVFSSDRNSVYNLYTYDLNTKKLKMLTDIAEGIFFPSSSNNGNILASAYYDGSYKIVEIDSKNIQELPDQTFIAPKNLHPYSYLPAELQINGKFKSRFSTDFIFPSFLYSTDIGFIGGAYWRLSDVVSNHVVDAYAWAYPGAYEVVGQYTLKKWRPDIFLSVFQNYEEYTEIYDDDSEEEFSEKGLGVSIGFSYPFDSFGNVTFWGTSISEEEENITVSKKFYEREQGAGVGYDRSTVMLKPFNAVRGKQLSLSAYRAFDLTADSEVYDRYSAYFGAYSSFSHKLVLASRVYHEAVTGDDSPVLDLGRSAGFISNSKYSMRGYSSDSFIGDNIAVLNAELRYNLFPEINGHIVFMWPDINLHSISVHVFSDIGTAWDDTFPVNLEKNIGLSYGGGFKLNFYMLQLAPVYINFDLARSYDDEDYKLYLKINSGYISW